MQRRGHHRTSRCGPAITITAVLAACIGLGIVKPIVGRAWAVPRHLVHITVAVLPALDSMPIYVAQGRGYFQKQGIEADIRRFQGGPAVLQAVLAGAAQFAHAGSVPFINATAHNAPLLAVGVNAFFGPGTTTMGIFSKKGSGITTFKQLVGHSFALNQHGNMESMILATQAYPKEGMAPSSVQEIEVPYHLMEQAIDGGRVDVAVTFQPFTTLMEEDPKEILIGYLDNYIPAPGYPITFAIVATKYAKEHPKIVAGYVRALNEALAFARRDPSAAAAITAKGFDLPESLVAKALKAIRFPRSETDVNPETWNAVVSGMKKVHAIPESYDIRKYLDIRSESR